MPRMFAALSLLALAVLAGPAHAQDARSARVARVDISEYPERSARLTRVDASRYPEVTVYVRVTDAAGRPVAGLAPGDFAVTEEGRAVSIERFADGASETFSAVLVVDRSGSMYDAGKLAGAKEAAAAFAAHMRSGDRAALVVFGDAPSLLAPLTGDPQELRSALRPVRPEGSTALYDALLAGVRQLEFAPGRRVLVLLTDGRDMISAGDPRPASRATIDEAIRAANAAQVPVLAIGLGERGAPGRDGIDEDVLRRIATETGGSYAYAADAAALADMYGALASGLQEEYALTYRSPLPASAPQRDIRVVVGALAEGGYQPDLVPPPPAAPEPAMPLVLLPAAALSIGLGAALLWRSRRIRDRAPRPPAAIGATVPLAARFCIECGQPMPSGAHTCRACGAPVEEEARR